eukprot:CAMPEP_0182931210 /NCGR_PEP_ID=MMETSP0105_2-20130417/27708_1 /TAXON_ID=81532 ORGANISM="Acanthoeca-like sp., Strain 10tr" /NCGR_SAMPLE_ID=MMETSP0105_2 /ASSEMBLY_ACC=CAM_ASM_000205 /LENGTH=45 /DNA_ID= /DNA_START= /DNA_END= /DNA_ORIENTATION=
MYVNESDRWAQACPPVPQGTTPQSATFMLGRICAANATTATATWL